MKRSRVYILMLLISSAGEHALGLDSRMVSMPSGVYESFVPEKKTPAAPLKAPLISVAAFDLDTTPVTNQEFLRFVQEQTRWQKDKVSPLFAESSYLTHWVSSLDPGIKAPQNSPVVYVSWFAARAYCQAQGKRLPSTYEWEYAAGPDFYGITAAHREAFLQTILEWYAKPSVSILGPVGQATQHRLGVRDLHGLTWEWTSDFSSNISSTEQRDNSAPDTAEFCGAATLGGKDPSNYASYMRFAFRSSLKGGFSLANLGFRCARDRAP